MTIEQLREFGEGKAFIDMEGTSEKDWIELIEQCGKVGIDLNLRAKKYYCVVNKRMNIVGPDYGPVQPFVYYQKEWNNRLRYLKCTDTDLASYGNNTLDLKVYMYEPWEDIPVFEI